ncbi:MAG TPA: flagellar brake domain-containing protein [Fervidobacterium sp.]|nr:flagellar brake domain-containing protein [Fervidobacterium sp.]HPT53392.1 flagellar brake domain-containing protein [Fervidobacterium sp.]
MAYVEIVDSGKTLKIGLPAVINIIFDKELEGIYKSNVVDIDFGNKIMFLSIPSIKGRFIPIPKGVRMTVSLFDRSSIYEFDTISLGITKIDNIYVIPVPFPESVRKTERRRFVRIELFLEGRLYLSPEQDAESFPFTTKNISAGGIMLLTRKYLNVEDIIYIDLTLSSDLSFNRQKSKIARRDEHTEEGFIYGVQFLDLSVALETKLVRFIFQRELKMKNMKK